jgi:hypothetical protein
MVSQRPGVKVGYLSGPRGLFIRVDATNDNSSAPICLWPDIGDPSQKCSSDMSPHEIILGAFSLLN